MSEHNQRFDSFEQWVSKASSWLTRHPEYNNTEHGEPGWRGHHFTAMCFDSKGRECLNGSDMQRARQEDAFPVHWRWPDQLLELAVKDALAPPPKEARQPSPTGYDSGSAPQGGLNVASGPRSLSGAPSVSPEQEG